MAAAAAARDLMLARNAQESGSLRSLRPQIPRNVKVLSAVSFFQDAASELVYPVLPLFVVGTLGAPAAALGLIEGVAEGTAAVGKAVSGRLADRFRRKPLIALGYGISSLSKPLIAFAGARSEEHTSELQSHVNLVCRL